ncbi:MAG: alpha,alpha-trehalase [Solirubrobacterales bacterium]|jgi:GH15 family glucan-1,4-alpha-glucosidase|nr:alpha,alpha-trehalase [Solirubrobacterales bacterium]
MQPGGFPPIADYGFLSDCHTGALVAADGSVEWMCVPRFDSPSVFGAVLDRGAGRFRIGPNEAVPVARRYQPGTNILETTWATMTGWLVVVDALTIGPWRPRADDPHTRPPPDYDAECVMVRVATCVQGEVPIELTCHPRFDYGRVGPEWEMAEDRHSARTTAEGQPELMLTTDLNLGIEIERAEARHTLKDNESRFVALAWSSDPIGPTTADDAFARLDRTADYWRRWLVNGDFPDHPWRIHLQRSALVLKGLTYAPTGALIAALTTSLPETPGGERNWDYRYTWIRDATFTLWALHVLGLDEEADDFARFIGDICNEHGNKLQIMYGIGGERDLTESTLDHLSGYGGAKPVRIGNGAFNQQQNDVYGALVDSIYIHSRADRAIRSQAWPIVADQVEGAAKIWNLPDQGIWEARGPAKHYVSSKLMCWVALDRGARLAKRRGDAEEEAARWGALAEEVRADILEHGVKDGVLRQHYDTDALDASVLLAPLVRFLPPDDEVIRKTVLAIADDLTDHGLVLRYRVDETEDGLHGEEGTFTICSFWLVSALSEIGEADRARELCEKLLAIAGPLRLYGEEIEPRSHTHLGNFPQAFTHLALINAVVHVIADQQRGDDVPGRTAVFSEMRERTTG